MIVPHVRRNILRGKNILFTGVEEISRAHMLARELGATIQPAFIPPGSPDSTTHVVAGRRDTEKVYRAALFRTVLIVTPDWLQACSARWERVEEKVFLWKDCLEYFRTVNRHQLTANTRTNSCEIPDSIKGDGEEQREVESNSRSISMKRKSTDDCNEAEKRIKLDDGDSYN